MNGVFMFRGPYATTFGGETLAGIFFFCFFKTFHFLVCRRDRKGWGRAGIAGFRELLQWKDRTTDFTVTQQGDGI